MVRVVVIGQVSWTKKSTDKYTHTRVHIPGGALILPTSCPANPFSGCRYVIPFPFVRRSQPLLVLKIWVRDDFPGFQEDAAKPMKILTRENVYVQTLSACVQTSWVCIDSSTAVVASQKEGFAFGVPVHPKVLYSRLRLEYSCEKLEDGIIRIVMIVIGCCLYLVKERGVCDSDDADRHRMLSAGIHLRPRGWCSLEHKAHSVLRSLEEVHRALGLRSSWCSASHVSNHQSECSLAPDTHCL